MNAPMPQQWHSYNRLRLSADLARIKRQLDVFAGRAVAEPEPVPPDDAAMLSALERLGDTFALDPFERDVVLLCTGVETDADLADRCAAAQGNPQWTRPTVGFVLAALPGASWHALSPNGTLRRMDIIRLEHAGEFVRAPIAVDEAVLHFLLDGIYRDPALEGIADDLRVPPSPVAEHRVAVGQALAFWESAPDQLPVLHLTTRDTGDGLARRGVAVRAGRHARLAA